MAADSICPKTSFNPTLNRIRLIAVLTLMLVCDIGFSKRMKNIDKMKSKYSIPMNRTLEEELHIVKELVLTVKNDLYDLMTDGKGLHKTLRQAETRIAQIEKRLEKDGKVENEVTGSTSPAQALTEKLNKGGNPENNTPNTVDEGHTPRFLEKYSLPNEIRVKVGQTATFRCPVTGNPMPRIMWLKDQKLFARKMAMTEAIKWKLNLHQVNIKDRGNYSCLLTNTHGNIKHTFRLYVIDEPTTTTTTRKPTTMSTTTTTTTPKPRTTSSKPMKKRKITTPQKSAPSTLSLRERPSNPRGSRPTKTPPKNRMATKAPPIWRVPSAMNSREIIGDEEKCEAQVAAGGLAPRRDCWDLKMYHCIDKSGVYNVTVEGQVYSVYCDMATDGGGWIVFQKRINGKVDFNRDWEEYKTGFGRISGGEFWWGNENLYVFTRDRRMRVRIDMADELNATFVEYDGFWISRESDYYRLNVEGFRGRGGEAFIQPVWEEESHHKMMFSTRDMDRDGSLANCAAHFGGGWWYNDCYAANLNGIYPRKNERKTPSLQWKAWKGPKKYLTEVTMKIRPAIAPSSVTWDFWYPEKDDSFRLHEHYQTYGGCC